MRSTNSNRALKRRLDPVDGGGHRAAWDTRPAKWGGLHNASREQLGELAQIRVAVPGATVPDPHELGAVALGEHERPEGRRPPTAATREPSDDERSVKRGFTLIQSRVRRPGVYVDASRLETMPSSRCSRDAASSDSPSPKTSDRLIRPPARAGSFAQAARGAHATVDRRAVRRRARADRRRSRRAHRCHSAAARSGVGHPHVERTDLSVEHAVGRVHRTRQRPRDRPEAIGQILASPAHEAGLAGFESADHR